MALRRSNSLVMLKRVDSVTKTTGCRPGDEVEIDFWHGRLILEGFGWYGCPDFGEGAGGRRYGVVGGQITGPAQIASGPFWVPASRRMMINQRWLVLAATDLRSNQVLSKIEPAYLFPFKSLLISSPFPVFLPSFLYFLACFSLIPFLPSLPSVLFRFPPPLSVVFCIFSTIHTHSLLFSFPLHKPLYSIFPRKRQNPHLL